MKNSIIRKVSFFFPIQIKEREEIQGSATILKSNPSEKQLVRSFCVGSNGISKIEERSDSLTGAVYFNIYKENHLWKSYTPRTSDTEIEYDIK